MNKGLDIVVSFDTTGSMYPVLSTVRNSVEKMVKTLMGDLDDLRIGVIAHGDYCDAGNPYTIRLMDLTDSQNDLCKFIKETKATSGGDADECYELVINTARTQVSWGAGRAKLLLLIGDANPHAPDYRLNTNHLDWKNEAALLGEAGVKIFSVHAMAGRCSSSARFYQEIARLSDGKYLTLNQFSDIISLIKATCYNEYSETQLNEYISVLRKENNLPRSLARNLDVLTGKKLSAEIEKTYVNKPGLTAVDPGRFMVMAVTEPTSVKLFIEDNGIIFKAGHIYYELTKSEEVAQYKEIILQDKFSGELFEGEQVRTMLKLLPQTEAGGAKERLSSRDLSKVGEYTIFIQSTSYNRKLVGNSHVLYETED